MRADSAKEKLLSDTQWVLPSRENERGVWRPSQRAIVLNYYLLLDALAQSHAVIVWVLDAHEAHRVVHRPSTVETPAH